MGQLELMIAELERKKEHIQRPIEELRQAEATHSAEDRRARVHSEAARTRRSLASRKGSERRKSAQVEQAQTGYEARAA